MTTANIREVAGVSHHHSLFVQLAGFLKPPKTCGDLCACGNNLKLSWFISTTFELPLCVGFVTREDCQLIKQTSRRQCRDVSPYGFFSDVARLTEVPQTTKSVGQVGIGESMRGVTSD